MHNFFFFLFIGISISSISQTSKNILLSVVDTETKAPIPFSTMHLQNNPDIGWVSDLHGRIQIKNNQLTMIHNDSLVVKSLGYFRKVIDFRQLELVDFKVCLQAQEFKLSEVIIKPSEDLAIKTIKEAISNRKQNSPSSINYFSCEKYNKTTIDFVPNKEYYSESIIEKVRLDQEKKHFLISEKYSNNKYERGEMTNESISSYRLSGFRNPSSAVYVMPSYSIIEFVIQ